jgi:hypothetical protein
MALAAVAAWVALDTGCQSTCAKPKDCGLGDFCYMADGVCITGDPVGFCQGVPTFCPAVVSPVCGCDNRTYLNGCVAAVHGVSIAETFACDGGASTNEAGTE